MSGVFSEALFFPVKWEEGLPGGCSMCWNNTCIGINELLGNNFHFFFLPTYRCLRTVALRSVCARHHVCYWSKEVFLCI